MHEKIQDNFTSQFSLIAICLTLFLAIYLLSAKFIFRLKEMEEIIMMLVIKLKNSLHKF